MLDKQPRQKGTTIHVGKVRNFTDRDVILTLMDPKYKYSMAFQFSDSITLRAGEPSGIDLSKAIRYEQSSGYTPLFELKKIGSEYQYKVYGHLTNFVVLKFKVETQIGQATTGLESRNQVARYMIGDADNRCINIQMFMLESSSFWT